MYHRSLQGRICQYTSFLRREGIPCVQHTVTRRIESLIPARTNMPKKPLPLQGDASIVFQTRLPGTMCNHSLRGRRGGHKIHASVGFTWIIFRTRPSTQWHIAHSGGEEATVKSLPVLGSHRIYSEPGRPERTMPFPMLRQCSMLLRTYTPPPRH